MNPDRALVLAFLADGQPAPIHSNPLARDLRGTLLQADPAQGVALLAFDPPERYLQGGGVIQGGIIATLLDFAMAFAAHARLPADLTFATASLTVDMLKPVLPGPLHARGHILRAGTRVMFAAAQLTTAGANETLATASAVLPLVPVPQVSSS